MKGLKIIEAIASKRRGSVNRLTSNAGVYRLRFADGRFASTGRTGLNIKGKSRSKLNYKNAVAGVRLELDKKLRTQGRARPNMRALGFPIIEGSVRADKSVKAFKVVQHASLSGKTGVSQREVRQMIADRNKRLNSSQATGVNFADQNPGGFNVKAGASGTTKGIKWNVNVNWQNRQVKAGIAAISAGAILRGGYSLYDQNKGGKKK